MSKITPYLWFDKDKALEAAKFYCDVFNDSRVLSEVDLNSVVSGQFTEIEIELKGQRMILLDVGPEFKFNEAISFLIDCDGQEEVDYYWNRLTENGGSESQCGWLKDKFGLSWQVVPRQFYELTKKDETGRVMKKLFTIKKIVIAELEEALAE